MILLVSICLLMGYFVLNSEGGTISSSPTVVQEAPPAAIPAQNEPPRQKAPPDQYSDDSSRDSQPKPLEEPPEAHQRPANQLPTEDAERNKQEVGADNGVPAKPFTPQGWKPQGNDPAQRVDKFVPAPERETWSERPQFEKALANVIGLLPDEVHMRELIRPFEGSGKEKMREMGLRTRAYRKYFEAWEALHMTTDSEGATYIRDDVIQYLRSHQRLEANSEFNEEGVDGMGLAQTIRSYEAYRAFLQKFANHLFPWTAPYFSDHMSLHAHFKKGGRGIVLTAGDDQAPYLLTTIYSYRQLGCTLPIEVMYLGDQDLGEDYRMELEALPGVVTRDIAQMTNDEGWKLAGWAAKPFAILLSSFREVIFIDADSLFFKNPEILFEEPSYKATGALFFRDRLIMPESKKRWLQQILPKPIPKLAKESRFWTGESGHQQESGVVVVDKWKHFIAMLLVTRFNGPDRDGNKEKGITGVYDMMYGDKETFWVGWLLAGDEGYAFHQGDAGIMGELESKQNKDLKKRDEPAEEKQEGEKKEGGENGAGDAPAEDAPGDQPDSAEGTTKSEAQDKDENPQNTICAPQLLHLDVHGKPLWFNGWLLHNKFAEKSKKRFARFEHYLIEPREVREPGAWQLADSNMCCLTTDADKTHEFSVQEKKILDMIMRRAEEMGMGDQR